MVPFVSISRASVRRNSRAELRFRSNPAGSAALKCKTIYTGDVSPCDS
jgi:hypothetical protein